MCLLSYFPAGVMPDAEHLFSGSQANADGSGYAVATSDGRLLVNKAMVTQDLLIDQFMELRKQHLGMPAMFHSRFGTGGVFSTYNVHPFQVGSDPLTVVAHNGIFPGISKKLKRNNPRSDTRVFAETVMPKQFSRLDRKRTRQALLNYITTGYVNKIAVITVNPRYRQNGYLINGAAGVFLPDGAWHSNYDYLPPLKLEDSAYWAEVDADAAADDPVLTGTCEMCLQANAVNQSSGVCGLCRTCQDCLEHINDCQCWFAGQDVPADETALVNEVSDRLAREG